MTLVVSRREVGVCRHEFEIEVPVVDVDAEYVRVARDYRRRVRIDGFRKGKAPLDLVRKQFAGLIAGDVAERLAPKYWRKAAEEEGVRAMLPPTVEPAQAVPGQPLRLTVTADVEPEVEIDDNRTFDLPEPRLEPDEAEVDGLLEQVQRQHATWTPVERPAARGDRIRGRMHRSAIPGYVPQAAADTNDRDPDNDDRGPATRQIDFELGNEGAWPELTDVLAGVSAGQKATFDHAETDGDIERQRSYEVEVEEVLERKLPDVDDEWASSLSSAFETVGDLRRRLADQARAQLGEQARKERVEAVLDQLRKRYPVALPEAAVEREAVDMARSYANELARQGFDFEKQQVPWEQVMESLRPRAKERVHASFLLDRIARKDGVEASAEDLQEALDVMARARNTNRGRLRRELEQKDGLETLKADLTRNLAMEAMLAANPLPGEPATAAGAHAGEGED